MSATAGPSKGYVVAVSLFELCSTSWVAIEALTRDNQPGIHVSNDILYYIHLILAVSLTLIAIYYLQNLYKDVEPHRKWVTVNCIFVANFLFGLWIYNYGSSTSLYSGLAACYHVSRLVIFFVVVHYWLPTRTSDQVRASPAWMWVRRLIYADLIAAVCIYFILCVFILGNGRRPVITLMLPTMYALEFYLSFCHPSHNKTFQMRIVTIHWCVFGFCAGLSFLIPGLTVGWLVAEVCILLLYRLVLAYTMYSLLQKVTDLQLLEGGGSSFTAG